MFELVHLVTSVEDFGAERIGTLSSTRVTQMFNARSETLPEDGNHDVHKMTHSAESERFGQYG